MRLKQSPKLPSSLCWPFLLLSLRTALGVVCIPSEMPREKTILSSVRLGDEGFCLLLISGLGPHLALTCADHVHLATVSVSSYIGPVLAGRQCFLGVIYPPDTDNLSTFSSIELPESQENDLMMTSF